jgi:hypothetical protein
LVCICTIWQPWFWKKRRRNNSVAVITSNCLVTTKYLISKNGGTGHLQLNTFLGVAPNTYLEFIRRPKEYFYVFVFKYSEKNKYNF